MSKISKCLVLKVRGMGKNEVRKEDGYVLMG